MPSACAPRSIDSSPAIDASRGVRCGIVSSPTTRSIVAEAMSPLIRARARGLSLTSTTSTCPSSCSARASSSIACALPPRGGSISTETTNSPARELPLQERLALGLAARDDDLALANDEPRARAAVLVDGVPDRRDLGRRRSAAAADDPRAELARVRGELGEVLGRRVREDHALAGEAREADVRERGERLAALAHALDARAAPPGGRRRGSRRSRRRRASARAAAACSAETPPSVCASSSKVRSATIGSDETARTARDRGEELVELVERLDHEEVDAAALEQLRLLGEDGLAVLRRAAERADRPGDEDVRAGHLARVARDLHGGLVDRRDVVLEVVLGELAAVRAEGVRLDDVRAGADEAEVERERRSRARGCSPPRGSAAAATALETSVPMPPSPTSGGPSARRSRNRLTDAFHHSSRRERPAVRSSSQVNARRGIGQAPLGDARGGGIDAECGHSQRAAMRRSPG